MIPDNKQPDVVLIVIDTHRRDRLSSYGYPRQTTPNIDAFAQQATVFENAISPAQWTIPAHASLFTGEYPTTHQTLQAYDTLDSRFDTLAKLLNVNGYQTTGFCNNPLAGILNNGFKRGFNTFYNYCGAVPSTPVSSSRLPKPFNKLWEWYTQQLRKASYPLQNAFAHSDFLFQLFLHPKIVPIWSRIANFKGQTARSIRDVQDFLASRGQRSKPQFVFFNLMETHLPFWPPDTFIDKFAPYFKESHPARDFMRRYNAGAFYWLLPLEEPLTELQAAVLNDLYDAEVNYQDHLLGQLLETLSQADNTLTIIVADHGEGIGDHGFMGHSFVTYQELVHVPLIIKFPEGRGAGRRIAENVSTRRLFHTVLDTARIKVFENNHRPAMHVDQFTLTQTVEGKDPEQGLVFAEAYSPATLLAMMEKRTPHLIEAFNCRLNRWAVYQGRHKLVKSEGLGDELFDLSADPAEEQNMVLEQPDLAAKLSQELRAFITRTIDRRPDNWSTNQKSHLDIDEALSKQLRALGYID